MKLKRVIELAQEAGLVYNEHLFGENSNVKCFPWHAERLRKFAELIEKELEDRIDTTIERA